MKRTFNRLLCAILIMAMVTPTPVMAQDVSETPVGIEAGSADVFEEASALYDFAAEDAAAEEEDTTEETESAAEEADLYSIAAEPENNKAGSPDANDGLTADGSEDTAEEAAAENSAEEDAVEEADEPEYFAEDVVETINEEEASPSLTDMEFLGDEADDKTDIETDGSGSRTVIFSEDFEGLAVGTTIASGKTPFMTIYNGNSDADQKVITAVQKDEEEGNVLQLQGRSSWSSENKYVVLLSEGQTVTFEADINLAAGRAPAFFLFASSKADGGSTHGVAGLDIKDGKFLSHVNDNSTVIETEKTYELKQWYRFKLILDNSTHTFDVYMDDEKINAEPLVADSATPEWLDIGAGNIGGNTAYYDNIVISVEGDGSVSMPPVFQDGAYQISTPEELEWFARTVSLGQVKTNAVLTDDITVNKNVLKADGSLNGDGSNFEKWIPIGNNTNKYAGTFDGQGHTISGLYFDDPAMDYVGLFGCTAANGTIQNVTLKDSYMNGRYRIGGICGFNDDGIIRGCGNEGTVSSSTATEGNYHEVGGICASNAGIITDCYNSGTVTSTGDNVGGICGFNGKTISRCRNSGTVTGSQSVAGIAGCQTNSISGCYNSGTITKTGAINLGGIVGWGSGTVNACYNTGSLISTNTSNIGGIRGYGGGTINKCFYLDTCITGGNDASLSKTAAEFASGEVCYFMNTVFDIPVWYQNLSGDGKDALPTLDDTHKEVFKTAEGYSNEGVKRDKDDFYLLGSADDLYWFADEVNNGRTGMKGKLTADISLNNIRLLDENGSLTADTASLKQWTPIGTDAADKWFTGTFDGQGHTISGLYYDQPTVDRVGLFGYVKSAAKNAGVRNIILEDSYIQGRMDVGGIIGYLNNSVVSGCINKATISGNGTSAGGICGHALGGTSNEITNCINTGMVNNTTSYTGGIVGCSYCKVSNCFNTGSISGTELVGGISGSASTIIHCLNIGTVKGTDKYVGSITGQKNNVVTECYYLPDTATDGDGVSQNGLGAATKGTATEDNSNMTVSKNKAALASGEVCWLLNGGTYSNEDTAWYQTLGSDALPVLDSTHDRVFKTVNGYTNTDVTPSQDADGYYTIDSATALYWFADMVNAGKNTISANLTKDITVNTTVLDGNGDLIADTDNLIPWIPIGTNSTSPVNKQFAGTFNGQGHTIRGLYFNQPETSYAGLFGYINSSGTIKGVTIENSYFNGKQHLGGICGMNDSGNISQCGNRATVTSTTAGTSASDCVGGICGRNKRGKVNYCFNEGLINSTGINTGGIVGANEYSDAVVTGSYNTGIVSGNYNVGSICGGSSANNNKDCCYLPDTAKDINGSFKTGIGNQADAKGRIEAVSEEQFASGEVCWLLNGGKTQQEPPVWYQNLDAEGTVKDGCPVLDSTHERVYGLSGTYSNTDMTPQMNSDGYYEIDSAEGLYWFADQVNTDYNCSISVNLTADIVLNKDALDADGSLNGDGSGLKTWTPIGSSYYPYSGTFDGCGHTISGLYCNLPGNNDVGLFSRVNNGTIKNLKIEDSYINGRSNVGSIAGQITGNTTVGSCTNQGTVNAQGGNAGGIIGYSTAADLMAQDCTNEGKVSAAGQNAGGIIGSVTAGTFDNCRNSGDITNTYIRAGGIIGYSNSQITVNGCTNDGAITAPGGIGGIIGHAQNGGIITGCQNNGAITATGDTNNGGSVGGIIGNSCAAGSTVSQCSNTANITGACETGGIIGYSQNYKSDIWDSYNTGDITARLGGGAAGIIAYNGNTYNCYNTGSISSNGIYTGAIIGRNGSTQDCYYLTGCAKDGEGTLQNAVGHDTKGNVTPDADGAVPKSASEFSSGEICWLLNGGEEQASPIIWFQNIDMGTRDASPVLDGTHAAVALYPGGIYANQPHYAVTITNGGADASGAGHYPENGTVTIKAGTKEGYEFEKWTSDDVKLADAVSANTTFTMPDKAVTVSANWTAIPYEVTVSGGGIGASGAGKFIIGDEVAISAGTKEGYVFAGWTSQDNVKFADSASANTTFTMPAKPVTVSANWAVGEYSVTITDGGKGAAGEGTYAIGAVVTISAGTREGFEFTGWTSEDGVKFTDSASANTTFTMPAKAVTVKAGWKAIPPITNPTGATGTDVTGRPIIDKADTYNTVPSPASLAPFEVNGNAGLPDKTYNGRPQTQKLKITKDGKTLKEGVDYKLVYKNNINAGKATITIIGAGAYTGTKDVTFNITGKALNKLKVVTDTVAVGGSNAAPIHVFDGQRELVRGIDYNYTFDAAKAAAGINEITIIPIKGSDYADGAKALTAKVPAVELAEGQKLISPDCITLAGAGISMTADGPVTNFDETAKIPEVTVKVGGDTLTKGTDYTVTVKNNKNAGTAYVTVKAKGKTYVGQATATFYIRPYSGKFSSVLVNKGKNAVFTGKLQTPAVVIKAAGANGKEKSLKKNKDYYLEYKCNINSGTAYVTVHGLGNYEGIERTYIFNIDPQNISKASKKIKSASSIELKYAGKVLKPDYDYTVTVTDSEKSGFKKVVIKGAENGNFKGEITKDKVKP